jgi:hypothetical protein
MRDTIPAYRYDGDRLIPCENYGPRMLVPGPMPPPVLRSRYYSRRERRRLARLNAGRRRMNAIRVSRERPPPRYAALPPPIALDGHVLRGYRGAAAGHEALLYLPAGEPLTDRHLRDVERAIVSLGARPLLSQAGQDRIAYRIARDAGDHEAMAHVLERTPDAGD